MDERELWQTWDTFGTRLTWLTVLRRTDTEQGQRVAQRTLDELPSVTALEALTANAQLVELLVSRRWYVMQAAREAGATWTDVGVALGMSTEEAQDWYRDKIAHREQYVPDFHDEERTRAALNDA
jgi:hypothetical protein